MTSHRPRGFLLIQVVVAFFVIFVVGVATLGVVSSAERSYIQAAQVRVAVQIAREGLESVRAGNLKPTLGLLPLPAISCRIGRSLMQFQPQLETSSQQGLLFVRSRVLWQEGGRNHRVEVKCFVDNPT
jgi:type II secretory pathway pseudopilin PulG